MSSHRSLKADLWVKSDQRFLELIQQHNRDVISLSRSFSFPRIFHFVWLGEKAMPPYAHYCIQSFTRHNPDWECKVWTDRDVESIQTSFSNYDLFRSSHLNYGIKSDLLRYEWTKILRCYGGVYVDIDYECLQSIDRIVRISPFFCGLSNTLACEVNNGIIGCVPNHPLIERINSEARMRLQGYIQRDITPLLPNEAILSFLSQPEKEQLQQLVREKLHHQTIALTGPGMMTAVLCDYFLTSLHSEVLVLPIEVFSLVPNRSMVNLSRLSDCSVLGQSSSLREVSEEDWRSLLLNYDYSLGGRSQTLSDDEVNWRDYDQVKELCLSKLESRDLSALVTAIHWWQRSWQSEQL